MSNVLVTGGAGFLGSVLVSELLDQGHNITVVDKGIFGITGLDRVVDRIKFLECGFESLEISQLQDFDSVCHLAGFSNDPKEGFSVEGNRKINTEYAIEFLKKCVEAQIQRFIFASSASVYGFEDKCGEITEDHEPNPKGHYAESKLNAERGMWQFKDEIDLVILRQGTLMGSSHRQRYDLVVNAMVKSAFVKGAIYVHGGGEVWRPMLNVVDAASAFKTIVNLDNVESNIYNIVHKNYRISELANYIVHCIGISDSSLKGGISVEFDYSMEKDYRSYMISGEKIKKHLGIVPQIGVLETVQTFMRNFEMGNDVDFDNPIYYNIKWIKLGMEFSKMLRKNPNVLFEFTEAES